MAANNLTTNQMGTVLKNLTAQVIGEEALATVNTGDFVSVGTKLLQAGYDALGTGISQVLGKTIFSIRAYDGKFKGLMKSDIEWGNHVRKITAIENDWENDERYEVQDYIAADMYKVRKPKAVQLNFYGQNVFQVVYTTFRDQYKQAFTSPNELQNFLTLYMTTVRNQIAQKRETVARATLANMIAGKTLCDAKNVRHLVTEYNDEMGTDLTTEAALQPANFDGFMKWVFATIMNTSDLMEERTTHYHMELTGATVLRHTPKDKQKLYMYSPIMRKVETAVLASLFHDEYLKIDYEPVGFWQAIDSADGINVTPSYIDAAGSVKTATDPVALANILGVLFDEEAVGVNTINEWSSTTPFNSAGGYTNTFYHFTERYYNDFTENFVVFVLD